MKRAFAYRERPFYEWMRYPSIFLYFCAVFTPMTYKLSLLLAVALGAIACPARAQTLQEVLKFSSDISVGSARGQAIGGATGALGGEIAAIYVNPAAAGFFQNTDLSFSLGYQHIRNTAYYLGNKDNSKRAALKFDNFTLLIRGKEKERPLILAMGVNRTNNFRDDVYYQGNSNSSQSLNYFIQADDAHVSHPEALLSTRQDVAIRHAATLAYQTDLISPYRDGDQYKFTSAAEADDNSVLVHQSLHTITHGGTTELALVFGKQRSEKLYLGGSLNFDFIKQGQQNIWTETNINPVHADLNYFKVTQTIATNGIGVNLKLGGIYKPVLPLNLGLTLQSPTWYGVNKEYQTDMLTDTKSAGVVTASTVYMVDDTTQMEKDNLNYSLRTPWKATASAVLLLNTAGNTNSPHGLISVDYELDDYRSMKLKYGSAEDNRYTSELVKANYRTTGNLRAGAELRYLFYALRLGFARYGSPYKDSNIDGTRTYYSGGVGYKANDGYYIDLSLITGGHQQRREVPYELLPNNYGYVNPPAVQINSATTRMALTCGVRF
ncbi:hypothetical protein [Chitinophaga ginsengisoli]|uniref:Outer membrane protein transport protein (OMPP1/FadL/TodX) n=1 Tax=Chitinophaga ginsengisoli TaxID=363837 RepID=A0A2P8FW76_9BACT|nr:hypothetical protein [Chitinophaga ginsengisoli]PSL25969.1 hypothetical protein CLV42_112175 [Chitinophaga ginsengisoli]